MYLRSVCRRLLRFPQPTALVPCQNANFCDQQSKSTSNLSEEKSTDSPLLDDLSQQKETFSEAADKHKYEALVPSSAAKRRGGGELYDLSKDKAEKFIANLDEDGLKRMEEIKKSIEILKAENKRVPEKLTPYHWKVLLTEYSTFSGRAKYLAKLCIDEWRKNRDHIKKAEKRIERQEKRERMEKRGDNPIWSIHWPDRVNEEKKWQKLKAVRSDIDIVFDLGFEQNHREQVNTAEQLQRCWGMNINHLQPLNLHLTSVHQNEKMHDLLKCAPFAPVNVHQESVFEVFPDKKNLVYLTPDGPQLKEFDPKKTYIIGGIVDLGGRSRLSYGKAKATGVKTASFPLNRYCNFHYTTRARYVLTFDIVLGIMLDMYLHHSWMVALRNNLSSRYLFWDDMENEEFVNAYQETNDRIKRKKFERQKNIMARHQLLA